MSVTPVKCDLGPLDEQEDIKPQVPEVRRNLFGPVDHQQLQQDFQRLFCMSVEVAKQRWNFDFQRDQPTAGSVEWEELPSRDVPAFYRSCVVRDGTARVRGASCSRSAPTTATQTCAELRREGTLRGTEPEPRTTPCLKRKQANITDFFRVTKRRLHHKSSSGP